MRGERNCSTFTECSVKICRFLPLSSPYWTPSEYAHRLIHKCQVNVFQVNNPFISAKCSSLLFEFSNNYSLEGIRDVARFFLSILLRFQRFQKVQSVLCCVLLAERLHRNNILVTRSQFSSDFAPKLTAFVVMNTTMYYLVWSKKERGALINQEETRMAKNEEDWIRLQMTNLSWKVRSIFNMHKVWRSWLFRNFSVTFIKSLNLSSIKPYLIIHQVAMWTLLYLVSEGFSFLVTRVWNFGKFIRHSLWRGRDLKTENKNHMLVQYQLTQKIARFYGLIRGKFGILLPRPSRVILFFTIS